MQWGKPVRLPPSDAVCISSHFTWISISHPALFFRTVLDKIIEFAKVLYVSHFVSGHRFDSSSPVVRLPQMQSVFLVCLSGPVHEVDISRHGQNSHEVLRQIVMLCCSKTFAPVAARFLNNPAKTVTKYFRCHLWQTDTQKETVETGTDRNHRKRHSGFCANS